MKFPYEEFDLSDVRDLPAHVARQQGGGGAVRAGRMRRAP